MLTAEIQLQNGETLELISQIRKGSQTAINRLLEKHQEPLRNMIRSRLDRRIQRRVDVSDVLQEVFVEANRRLKTYVEDPKMPFSAWIRQIAKDRMIDAHRRHRGSARRSVDREQAVARRENDDRSSSYSLEAIVADRRIGAEQAAIHREMTLEIEKSIAQLNEQDRRMIIMRHVEMRSNGEIARELNLTDPAASMRYLRAIRRLKTIIQTSNPGSLNN